jgi:hypothetical protein
VASLSLTTTAAVGPADRLDTLPSGWPEDHGLRTLGFHAWGFTRGLSWDWREREWRRGWYGLVQPNGPRAGLRFRPTARQLRFWLWFYALDDAGQWLFSDAVRRLPKGSGKSPTAAVHCLIEFCGDVRLDSFDDRFPGGTVGRPVDLPWVQIAATAESQTKNTMRMVRAFAPKGSAVVETFHLDPGKQTYYRLPEGTLEVITSSATAAEGAEPTFLIGDEREHWRKSNGGVEFAATVEDNLAKSGARMVGTENAWIPGQDSVAEASWDSWVAQEERRVRGDGRTLYDAVIAPPDGGLDDPVWLQATLERLYQDCDWKKPHDSAGDPMVDEPPDVRSIMQRIYDPKSRPDDSIRKYLNRPTAAEDAWVELSEWQQLAVPDVEVGPDEPVVLFFDGSTSRDATALVGCRVEDGHVFTVGVWEPDPYDPLDRVDAADVDLTVIRTFDRFRVVAFFADVREWEQFALTEWPSRYKDVLKVWAAPQARPPQPVAWDMRGHAYEFAKATEACHADIEAGSFSHDGHPATTRHVGNARRRPYRDAVAVGKESPDSPRKIDAAVCVIGARMVRRIVLGSGKRLGPRKPSKVVVLV